MTDPPFTSTVAERDGEVVVVVCGDVDIETAPLLFAAIQEATTSDVLVVVDLAQSRFIDSSGLGALVRAANLAGPGRLAVRSPRRQARKLLEVTGISGLIAVVG